MGRKRRVAARRHISLAAVDRLPDGIYWAYAHAENLAVPSLSNQGAAPPPVPSVGGVSLAVEHPLAERKQAWEERQETADYYDQKAELPGLKGQDRPTLQEVHSQVLQNVVLRLKKAFD